MPILCALLFGMITTGFAYSDHLSVTNAVREGARYGAVVDYAPPPPAPPANWAESVRDRVKQVYFNAGSTLTDNEICVQLVDASTSHAVVSGNSWTGTDCGDGPSAPEGMAAGTCAVKVWVSKPHTIQLIVFPDLDFNVGAQSVAYYGRTVLSGCTAE